MSTVITETNNLFPIFLKLENMRLLIVGGGYVGMEKLQAVLNNSPETHIHIVGREISAEIKELVIDYPNVRLFEKSYNSADLVDIDLVIVAINEGDVSAQVVQDARAKGILVNAADKPDLCDFYLSSVVKKGNLKIAISTNGKSPTAAKRIKEMLNHTLPDELDDVLHNLQQIRNGLKGSFEDKVKRLNSITSVLVENENSVSEKRWRKVASYSALVFALMLIGHFIFSYVPFKEMGQSSMDVYHSLDPNFGIMLLAGFVAQLVDGALGMGYGVTSATVLLSAGIPPVAISGSIHTAEMFASGASGYSHYKFGNVNKKLFKVLVIPGVLGAIFGALLLYYLGDKHSNYIRPVLACYTLILGIRIFINAFKKLKVRSKFKRYGLLAGAGGFLDSFGGGGWGPIVTTTLITKGGTPKYVIGTVSLTEFFVTLASAFTFFAVLGVSHWQTIIGLIIGGVIAAPIAAKLAGRLPRKASFILLGLLVMWWSIRILIKIF